MAHQTNGSQAPARPAVLTVEALARHKQLPAAWLRELGLEDSPKGVAIPYRDQAGELLRTRIRTAAAIKDGTTFWGPGKGSFAYGQDRLHQAARLGYLPIVEGESDCWTLWLYNLPGLGIPGASNHQTLQADFLAGVDRVYIWRELDETATRFVKDIAARLGALGFGGQVFELAIAGVKDPSALHCQDAANFKTRWQAAVAVARALEVPRLQLEPLSLAAAELPSPRPPSSLENLVTVAVSQHGTAAIFRYPQLMLQLAELARVNPDDYALCREVLRNGKVDMPDFDRSIKQYLRGMEAMSSSNGNGKPHSEPHAGGDEGAGEGAGPLEAPDDPHRLATLYLKARCTHEQGLTLRFWREEWWRWTRGAYRALAAKELRAELTRAVKAEMNQLNVLDQAEAREKNKAVPFARKVTGNLVGDALRAAESMTVLAGGVRAPAWISPQDGAEAAGPCAAGEVLACQNGLLHIPSFHAGQTQYLWPATPAFFSVNCLDYDFAPQAPRPTNWLYFLEDLWPNDQACIDTLQEWFGYVLTADTRQQKILFLIGPQRSGKGTISRVIHALLGHDNVVAPTLGSLAKDFGLAPLLGKTLATIQDARISGRSDVATITESLLSISGEDAQTVNRKNLPAVTTKLAVRFMIFSNELPRLRDASGALVGRMILLPLVKSFKDKEDPELLQRLLPELPGILLWAIEGWARLRARRRFQQPPSGRDLLNELADLLSPVGAFVRDRCQVNGGWISCDVLFKAWKSWCEEQDEHAGNAATFGRNLRAEYPELARRRSQAEGDREWVYTGICLR